VVASQITSWKKSCQIQRWALTKLGPIRDKTTTDGLEIITKTIPLHIHLQEISLKTVQNFININFNLSPSPKGHLIRWLEMLKAMLPNDKGLKKLAPYFQNRLDEPHSIGEQLFIQMGLRKAQNVAAAFS